MIEAPVVEQTQNSHNLRRLVAMSAIAGSIVTPLAACNPAESQTTRSSGVLQCTKYVDFDTYHNHEYEACTAYIVNSSEIALQGFYKFGNNLFGYLSAPARHHFKTRYVGAPRQKILREVDSWPRTTYLLGNTVEESIDLRSLSANLKADRALLRTRENWRVTAPNGQVLHEESDHARNITMCRGRLPGHPLHLWYVAKFQRDPDLNCRQFDRQHGYYP